MGLCTTFLAPQIYTRNVNEHTHTQKYEKVRDWLANRLLFTPDSVANSNKIRNILLNWFISEFSSQVEAPKLTIYYDDNTISTDTPLLELNDVKSRWKMAARKMLRCTIRLVREKSIDDDIYTQTLEFHLQMECVDTITCTQTHADTTKSKWIQNSEVITIEEW